MERILARVEFGLHADAPTVLVSGGGTGRGRVLKIVASLAQSSGAQILAVAGHKKGLLQQLEAFDVRAPARLAQMREAALRAARPRAACEIIDMFLEHNGGVDVDSRDRPQ